MGAELLKPADRRFIEATLGERCARRLLEVIQWQKTRYAPFEPREPVERVVERLHADRMLDEKSGGAFKAQAFPRVAPKETRRKLKKLAQAARDVAALLTLPHVAAALFAEDDSPDLSLHLRREALASEFANSGCRFPEPAVLTAALARGGEWKFPIARLVELSTELDSLADRAGNACAAVADGRPGPQTRKRAYLARERFRAAINAVIDEARTEVTTGERMRIVEYAEAAFGYYY